MPSTNWYHDKSGSQRVSIAKDHEQTQTQTRQEQDTP